MQTCPKCSKPLPADVQFCVECGQPVAKSPTGPTCPQCHAPLSGATRFCTGCGHNLAQSAGAPAPPGAAAGTSWPRLAGLSLLGILGLLLLWKGTSGLRLATSPSSSATSVSVTATPVSQPPSATAPATGPDLAQLADTWSVDPGDPAFVPDSKEGNEVLLRQEGTEVKGHGPENATFRFWAEGDSIVGEVQAPGGQLSKVTWEWVEPGQKARLRQTGDSQRTVTLRRGAIRLTATPSEVILYQVNQDLNGDRQSESARVVALDNNPEPNSPSRKILRIYAQDGSQQFQSEPFEEPFHTDVDSVAEKAQEKAGLHVVAASTYPRIRLIFASHSGNFVDFQFNGRDYVLAEIGD